MKTLEYAALIVPCLVTVIAIYFPDKVRPNRKLTTTGWSIVMAAVLSLGLGVRGKISQDAADEKKLQEYRDRIRSVQSQIILCFDAGLVATLKYFASDVLPESEWRLVAQSLNIGRTAHSPDLKPEFFQQSIRPMLLPLTYARILDVRASIRGKAIPNEERTWREIFVAQFRYADEQLTHVVATNRGQIPFSLEQRLTAVANISHNLAEIYTAREEEKRGRDYIVQYLPALLWNGTGADGQLIRIQVGVE